MKGKVYRSYHIIGTARFNQNTSFWIPAVRVRWTEAGQERRFELDGPPNRFQTKDEAEDYALTMGENWIDQNNPLP